MDVVAKKLNCWIHTLPRSHHLFTIFHKGAVPSKPMGLSLHYSGTLINANSVWQLIEEVSEVCTILGWDQHISDNGILFVPPECEPLLLHFKADGELVNNLYLQYNIKPASKVSVKTQYAGVEVHIAVVKLLRHLSTAYFKTFHLDDEGYYWATGDEAVLRQRFAAYNTMLMRFAVPCKSLKRSPMNR